MNGVGFGSGRKMRAWATEYDVEETSGGAYQSNWTEKDATDRVKWRNGVNELLRSTR